MTVADRTPPGPPSTAAIDSDERTYWVLLNQVQGIGPVRFQRLLDVRGTARAAWDAPLADLAAAGLDRKTAKALLALRKDITADAMGARLERLGVTVLTLADPEYPALLRETADPPPVLFVRGASRPTDFDVAVAIVGTRRSTSYGRTVAERIAGDLARAGVVIVSGLARGIDTIAHRAALDAGGRTIAVLGNGLDQVYPPENAHLARRIVDQDAGALLSEFGPGIPPDAVNFPRRNRIVAGLCRATLIVEAGHKSGALITADFALEQGREVLAVPGSILSPMSAGANALLRQGATPITSAEDVLESLGLLDAPQSPTAHTIPLDLTPEESATLALLAGDPLHVDEIARALDTPSGPLTATLTMLELRGLIRQAGPMAYVRA